jgi:hypothetical protein
MCGQGDTPSISMRHRYRVGRVFWYLMGNGGTGGSPRSFFTITITISDILVLSRAQIQNHTWTWLDHSAMQPAAMAFGNVPEPQKHEK